MHHRSGIWDTDRRGEKLAPRHVRYTHSHTHIANVHTCGRTREIFALNKSGSSGLTLMTHRIPINCRSLENRRNVPYFIHGPSRENPYKLSPEKWHAVAQVDPLATTVSPLSRLTFSTLLPTPLTPAFAAQYIYVSATIINTRTRQNGRFNEHLPANIPLNVTSSRFGTYEWGK